MSDLPELTVEDAALILVMLRLRSGPNDSTETRLTRQIMMRQAVIDYHELKRSRRRQPLRRIDGNLRHK